MIILPYVWAFAAAALLYDFLTGSALLGRNFAGSVVRSWPGSQVFLLSVQSQLRTTPYRQSH